MRSFAVLVLLLLLVPREARAWASAQVTTARAEADVAADGALLARFELEVRVLGGWLTELEVAGLDAGLVLESLPQATFTRATGEPVPFEIVGEPSGRVLFRFREGSSPRVGAYVATFAYRASIAESGIGSAESDPSRVAYAWTFPAWDTGLDSVEVVVRAPEGAVVERSEGDALTGTTSESGVESGRPRFTLRRLHLPRSIPWTVAFTLPRSAVPTALRPADAPRPVRAVVATSRDGRPQPSTRVTCAAFVVVALVKRRTFSRRARARHAIPRPLVPIASDMIVSVLVVALGVGAALVWPRAPELAFVALVALVALVAQRPARRVSAARIGAFRTAAERDVHAARWANFIEAIGPASWFDATRAFGFVVALASIAGLSWLHLREPADSSDAVFSVPHALVLLGLLFVVSGASMVPRSVEERLVALAAIARTLRVPADAGRGFAFRLALHRDVHDVAQDARLRLSSEHRAKGLVRLDVALVERATLGGYVVSTVLLAVVRQGSPAERILGRALPTQSVKAAPGGRRARVLPLRPSTWAAIDPLASATEPRPSTSAHAPHGAATESEPARAYL